MVKIKPLSYDFLMKPIIIHISNDFPDIVVPDKTKAIERLVDGTPEFQHIVYSLNRINGWKGIKSCSFGVDRTAISYKALPKGLFWEPRLSEVAKFIINEINQKKLIPDAIHGHKLTVEGLIAQEIATYFKKPLMLSIQGDTDTKILEVKRSLRKRFQKIANDAQIIFPFSHWPISVFKKYIRLDDDKISILPVVPAIDILSPASVIKEPRLLTVFHLDSWKRKNIVGMLKALKIVKKNIPSIRLDIYGGGSIKSTDIVRKLIEDYGLEDSVSLCGSVSNGNLPQTMKKYAGFILPSKRETYGLVYVEALFSGLPVLISKDKGIDGFFPRDKIGYACNPNDESDIAVGIQYIVMNQDNLKSSIAYLQETDQFSIVRQQNILNTYRSGINKILTKA